jgi:hypothetical protein
MPTGTVTLPMGIEYDGAQNRGQELEHFYRLVRAVPAVVNAVVNSVGTARD